VLQCAQTLIQNNRLRSKAYIEEQPDMQAAAPRLTRHSSHAPRHSLSLAVTATAANFCYCCSSLTATSPTKQPTAAPRNTSPPHHTLPAFCSALHAHRHTYIKSVILAYLHASAVSTYIHHVSTSSQCNTPFNDGRHNSCQLSTHGVGVCITNRPRDNSQLAIQ
jgi:hypothetical protein